MRSRDPEIKKWAPPFTRSANYKESIQCTEKALADGVESLIGAFYLSNNLYKTLKWISDIKLVPLKEANLLSYYPDENLTF